MVLASAVRWGGMRSVTVADRRRSAEREGPLRGLRPAVEVLGPDLEVTTPAEPPDLRVIVARVVPASIFVIGTDQVARPGW